MTNKETDAHERKMARTNNSVITIKNILDEDFTHNYDGIPYTIKAGETLPYPFPVGSHIAKHMAMRHIRTKAEAEGKLLGKNDQKSVTLYGKEQLGPYIARIIVETKEEPLAPVKSPADVLKEKTADLQSKFPDQKKPEVTKKEIIKTLRKKNIKFDARAPKEELLQMLIDAEMKG